MKAEIKKCTVDDIDTLYEMTRELIVFHGMADIFTLTKDRLAELISTGTVQSYIAYVNDKAAACANFFYKYTTFSGRKILYLEDLYSRSEYRHLGLGRKMFELLKQIAHENDCERIEWKCADFNNGGKEFYRKIGAMPENVWITYTIERSDFMKGV